MSKRPFVHLHLHTQYSLLDGAVRIPDLMKRAAEYEMPAVAMTDHGNLFGAVDFFQAAKKSGIKPIIGCEVYVAPGSRLEKKASSGRDAAYHFTLLAETDAGYRNLVKLVSLAHLEGFYYKPRVDHETLSNYSEGLIALSGCLKGEVSMHLQGGQPAKAAEVAATYREIFGKENFFVELQDHGIDAQRVIKPGLLKIASDLDLGFVATNDVHFLDRSHHEAHDVMICIGTGSMIHDEKRMRYSPELFFKSGDEMALLFADHPEALANTLAIADRCSVDFDFKTTKYPEYHPPAGKTPQEYLRELCFGGLRERYGERVESDPQLVERLEYELSIIEKTGFISYFLIVWDFINFAKERGIPVGPGRGSAAGSLIAYVLKITDLDPLRFGLIFERFLNPERVSPPDIDVDFCMDRRGEVIEYVRQKYGEKAVSQIVTFGTLGAKSVVRDVARVLGMGYSEGDRIAKMIPNELNITLSKAAEMNPDLKTVIENDSATRQLWDYAVVLEGLNRNTGIHAAGVVIGDRPLDEYIPLCRGKDEEVVTQYSMSPLTDLGMLKMDFLGLKTLTVIHDAVTLIRERVPDFDLSRIPDDDQAAFDIYNRGETVGVFQVEGGGITNCCKRFDVRSIDDIIAILALYRPGPMQFIPDYIERKKGLKKVDYAHPLLEEVCADTYGIMIYQEQVQRAANVLAGYSLGQADLLRRAMGKKDKEKMAKERVSFVEGCARVNAIGEKQANAIFGVLEKFAEYGFNKSHSAAYGLISYQTAYLKAHYPVEFMCGLMSNDSDHTEKIATLIAECQRMGITMLPPDVNESKLKFAPVRGSKGNAIRFGLAAIKNVGAGAMEAAIAEREGNGPFNSLEDFCARLDSRSVNRKIVESLVKCGAFDSFETNRARVFLQIEDAMAAAAAVQKDRASGQASLFDDIDDMPAPSGRNGGSDVEPWPQLEMLSYEKELLGFYVTGHPLDAYAGSLEGSKFSPISDALAVEESASMKLGGIVVTAERKFTRKDNRPFVVFSLEDFTGSLELTAWDEAASENAELLVPGSVIGVSARISRRDEAVRATATSIVALKPRPSKRPVELRMALESVSESDLVKIADSIQRHPGKRPVVLGFKTVAGEIRLRAGKDFCVGDERALREELAGLLV